MIIIALLLAATASRVTAAQRVEIACERDRASVGPAVSVTCNLVNKLSEPILVPVTSFAAEGPDGSPYIYKYVFGERYEHVFQYDLAAHGTLEKPILFEPVVHLSSQAIQDLRWLPPNGSATIRVEWTPPQGVRGSSARWQARAKMVYARLSRFENAATRTQGSCRAMAAAPLRHRVVLPASRWTVRYGPPNSPSYDYDDCHDILSEAFEHVVSSEFGFVLNSSK